MPRLTSTTRLTATGRSTITRYNYRVATGTYSGTGSAGNTVNVGFRPRFIIIKGGTNISAFWTRTMGSNLTLELGGANAGFTGGITEITDTGFVLGTDSRVNASSTTYYYLVFRGVDALDYLRTITYIGNGLDNRNLDTQGIFFTPDIFWVRSTGTQSPAARISTMIGDNSHHFSAASDATDEIQAFITNGVQLGAANRVNGSGMAYHAIAWRNYPSTISNGSYTGNGLDNMAVDIGFQPDWVLVKDTGSNSATLRTIAHPANTSSLLSATGDATNRIKSFTSTGFTVGTSVAVNTNGNTYWYTAGKIGDFNLPITRNLA